MNYIIMNKSCSWDTQVYILFIVYLPLTKDLKPEFFRHPQSTLSSPGSDRFDGQKHTQDSRDMSKVSQQVSDRSAPRVSQATCLVHSPFQFTVLTISE